MCENVYDMIIVGSGPAGLTAGIYGKRAGLKVVILESGFIPVSYTHLRAPRD